MQWDRWLRLKCFFLMMIAIAYAYFYAGGGWNQNSRFALTRSIVEMHSISIDPFHESTGDKSIRDGHYYSDKAPGLSLIAVPIYAVIYPALTSVMEPNLEKEKLIFSTWILTFLTSGLSTLILAFFLHKWASQFMSEREALFVMISFALASPAWIQSQLFFGHAVSSMFLFLTFYMGRKSLTVAGFFGSMAIMVEYPLVVPVTTILLYSIFAFDILNYKVTVFERIQKVLVGSLLPMVILAWYHLHCFGSVFKTGYSFLVAGHEGMNQGWFGFTMPSIDVLWKLTFGSYRGLFLYSPILVISFYYLVNHVRFRFPIIALCTYGFLWNASYLFWEGGWSFEPRHLTWILPFLALGSGLAFRRKPLLTSFLLGLSTVVQFIVAATCPTPPSELANPFLDLNLRMFGARRLSINPQSFSEGSTTLAAFFETPPAFTAGSNLGKILGLSGLFQLWPFVFLLSIACIFWIGTKRKLPAESQIM